MDLDDTKIKICQTIGTNKYYYSLATVLQVLKATPTAPHDARERLLRGDRIQSLPGISYQIIPAHVVKPSTG